MSIPVFIPILSKLALISSSTSCISDLLKAIWGEENLRLADWEVKFSQLSLRSLVSDLLKNRYSNSDLTET
jgi:hypothetical protein